MTEREYTFDQILRTVEEYDISVTMGRWRGSCYREAPWWVQFEFKSKGLELKCDARSKTIEEAFIAAWEKAAPHFEVAVNTKLLSRVIEAPQIEAKPTSEEVPF